MARWHLLWLNGVATVAVLCLADGVAADQTSCDPAAVLQQFSGYTSGSFPRGLALADFNGDGLLDVAVANSNDYPVAGSTSTVSIHLGVGGGRFAPPQSYPINGRAYHVATGDFDLDGHVDLVVANFATNSVSLLRGVGDGTFLPPVDYPAGTSPSFVLARDFNHDVKLDLAVLNSATGGLSILLNQLGPGPGQGTFSPPTGHVVGDTPGTVTSGDFNGDGTLDLAVTLNRPARIAILFGTGSGGVGDGGFGPPALLTVPDNPWTITAQDLNGDGILDLAVTGVGWLTVLLGHGVRGVGDGTFSAPVSYANGFVTEGTLTMASGDFTRDGITDFVVSFGYVGQMALFEGRGVGGVGDGSFATPRIWSAPSSAGLVTGDFTGDGHPDLAALLYSLNGFWVFLDSCATAVPPPVPLVGSWTAQGKPLSFGAADQTQPAGISDGADGAIIAWRDSRLGAGASIYAVRIDAQGNTVPGWSTGGNAICTGTGDRKSPVVVPDNVTGAYIGWIDTRDGTPAVYIQHVLATGARAPGWPANGLRAFSMGVQSAFGMDSDGKGGVLICDDAPSSSYYPQLVINHLTGSGATATGWPLGGMIFWTGYNPATMLAGPYVVGDGAGGGYAAAYHYQYPCIDYLCVADHYTNLFRVKGTSVTTMVTAGHQDTPFLAGDGAGGILFGRTATTSGFDVSRFDAAGVTQWTGNIPSAASWLAVSDGRLGAICSTTNSATTEILARHIDGTGVVSPSYSVGISTGTRYLDNTAADGQGGAYFCWTDFRYGRNDLFATRLSGQGVLAQGWTSNGNPVCTAASIRELSKMFGDGQSGAIVVWSDDRDGGYRHVYAQHLVGDGPVPVLASLVGADADPDRVRLTWYADGDAGIIFRVDRHEPQGGWHEVGSAPCDGSGRIVFVDRSVTPGHRYGYRLQSRSDPTGPFLGEAWIEVPTSLQLTLDGARPNPAARDFLVAFTLPSAAPATLELVDVSGRVIDSREVGTSGAGRHVLNIANALRMPPGILFVRLTQAGQSRVSRVSIVR